MKTAPASIPPDFAPLMREIRACRICADHLPFEPRPILAASPGARLLIIGQAPGTRAHESGTPWNDASGDRLRDWLGLNRDQFYDPALVALIPAGFCYPGVAKTGGDLPPRPECASQWHPRLLPLLTNLRLTLLVGGYAQALHFKSGKRRSVTETVQAFRELPETIMPLPHPSWRTSHWEKRHPWFDAEVKPVLRARVTAALEAQH